MPRSSRSLAGWRWVFRDGWAFCKGDADNGAPLLRAQFRQEYPGAQVRTVKRSVRAGGGDIPLTVVFVRVKEACCTCGQAYERGYKLEQKCRYCEHGADHLSKKK